MWLTPRCRANLRLLQWVEPSAADLRVHSRILASSAGVRFSAARPRWCEYNPANRSASKRLFQRLIKLALQPSSLANRQVRLALRQQQDQPRTAHILGRQGARAHSIPQFLVLLRGQSKLSIGHPLPYTNPIPMSLLQATSIWRTMFSYDPLSKGDDLNVYLSNVDSA